MVDFTRAFNSAWERMMVILFRPFDLNKWFVVGFSAFLAGLLNGGNGFNSFNGNNGNTNSHGTSNSSFNFSPRQEQQALGHDIQHLGAALQSMQIGAFIIIFVVVMVFVLALVVLMYWLGSRGQFLLLDNVVRNRGAIAEPWRQYARHGNAVFGFHLILLALSFVLMLVILVPVVLLAMPFIQHDEYPTGPALGGFIAVGGFFGLFIIGLSIYLFLFHEWGIPLIFRNGLTVREALAETWRLMSVYPGTAALFVLLRIALWIGLVILSLLACCLTCCLAVLPYLGTVVLLPALLFIKCFSLDVLAQFGPDHDVFTVDLQPAHPDTSSLPPQPG